MKDMKLSDYVAASEQGEIVQWLHNNAIWYDHRKEDGWNASGTYRLKPKLLELWVNTYQSVGKYLYETAEAAKTSASLSKTPPTRTAVHMREVV